MMELTIDNQVYQFNFGIGFLREMNRKTAVPVSGMPGVKKSVGFKYAVASIIDGDVESLIDLLDVANKNCTPRVTKALLDSYVDNQDTDIEGLFSDVLDFLKRANATRKETMSVLEVIANPDETATE